MQRSDCKSHTVHEVMEDHDNLQPIGKEQLLQALSPFETLFDHKLGSCTGKLSHFRAKNYHNLRHQTTHNITNKFSPLFKQEVDLLMSLGDLTSTNHATHAALCFVEPKKDDTILFLAGFQELNKCAIREPFTLPKLIT